MQIQDDCTALIKENAALSAQVVELQKQIDMASQLSAYVYVILGAFLWDDLDQDQDQINNAGLLGASKELINRFPEWIHRFLRYALLCCI